MKRTAIKKRPLSDTTLASLEPEDKDYRELDSNGLYFLVQKKGNKSWQLRYKKPDGKWSWMGLGAYPAISGALARKKANEILINIYSKFIQFSKLVLRLYILDSREIGSNLYSTSFTPFLANTIS
ncbi:hypothetical protein B9Y01_17330 [Acinetobacter baumannii]|jgi:hypothetical protein|uniref:DUF4102 domain-containing protein n=1 Tax=Acinetobacter baumannii TaxID=470 RepID=A0A3R9T4W7_ACIBA|nr:DUF4102 domain-containing protein [Acinetobacter baumannii]ENV26608.1 hypothetical protein F962_01114 [Acinetobacter baumannii NIPH 190]KQD20987.1 hypothetical protein APD06_08330 [Acinetobacter baumannii]KQD28455.1 hypothetical protein APD11_00170 [Acinetobacter baumannii]KQE75573.1 hypothetical protein APB90_12225 [Acinetobacter baumannii]